MDEKLRRESEEEKVKRRRVKRRVKRWLTAVCVLLTTAAAGAVLFYFLVYRVEPVFSTTVYELGDPVSREAGDYLAGTKWSVNRGEVDLSGVDGTQIGSYEAVVRHGNREYHYQIVIEDTVPPEILLPKEEVYLAAGREITAKDVIEGIRDKDKGSKACFYVDGSRREMISFDAAGEYMVRVLAEDGAGNQSFAAIKLTVDTAPVMEGIEDFYVALGSDTPDYLEGITAFDDVDGDLTDSIFLDDSGVRLSEEGDYQLSYSVEDSYGLITEAVATVDVLPAQEIQSLIGGRKISRERDRVVGAVNPYDGGAGETDNLDYELDYMRPAMVQLYRGNAQGYSSGSGYIMEITDDFIYICSNNHVVGKYDEWDIYFYDGTVVKGVQLGVSEEYDVGVAAVRREDVPERLLEKLMTVHIDKSYWETLDEDDIEVGLLRVDRNGGVLHSSEGWLIKVQQEFIWENRKDHTEITARLVRGDSGSAVLDGHGNLIAMAYAYSGSPTRYWCIPLNGILDCYKEITGRTPYVY